MAHPAAPDFIQVYRVLARLVGARVEGRGANYNRLIAPYSCLRETCMLLDTIHDRLLLSSALLLKIMPTRNKHLFEFFFGEGGGGGGAKTPHHNFFLNPAGGGWLKPQTQHFS